MVFLECVDLDAADSCLTAFRSYLRQSQDAILELSLNPIQGTMR